MRAFEETAFAFDRACRRAGVRYAFVGGLAVNAWGVPRNTADIDVLLRLEPDLVQPLAEALRAERLAAQPEDLSAAFGDYSHVTVFDDEGSIHLDLKLARSAGEAEQVESAVELRLPGGPLRVARPEDTIAFKLKYGTPQDVADARGILERQGKRLDMARLDRIAASLGVAAALRRLLAGRRSG